VGDDQVKAGRSTADRARQRAQLRAPGRIRAIATSLPRTVVLGAGAGAAVLVGSMVAAGSGSAATQAQQGLSHYQEVLRSQVQQPDGAPSEGRDPARQKQTGLLSAAQRPQGPGLRGRPPAADVESGGHHHPASLPSSVLQDPKKTGVLSSGCALDYGRQGVQCLPARAPGNKPLSCAYVLTLFPDGVVVSGRDRFGLDTNRDGVACDRGDREVPDGHRPGH
jgi:hypothetical protein